MSSGAKEDKAKPKGGSKCFKLSIIFLVLNISSFAVPATGFSLRNGRISQGTVKCSMSHLTAVPHDIPSSVKGFDLSSNNISTIQVSDFKNLPHLAQLDLKHNNISHIDKGAFADLISLKNLNLNDNKLVQLGDDLFDGLRNLTELRIKGNHITVVAPDSFKSLTSLKVLDISQNKLRNLTAVHFILQHLPNLKTLSIQNNSLTSFQSWEMTNSSLALTSLDVSQNPLAVFGITADVFPHLTSLTVGDSREQLMKWDVQNKTFLHRVSALDISGLRMVFCDIQTLLQTVNSSLTSLKMNAMILDLEALINISCTIPKMSKLQLRHNNLSFVSSDLFWLCVNVAELDLTSNQIQDIQQEAFSSLRALRILSLSRNRLPCVPAAIRNLPALAKLDLSTNMINTLGCNDFANMTRLRELSLYLNSISSLEECLFKDLIQLQVLKLQNNHISTLNGAFKKYLPNLRQLHLNENYLTALTLGEFKGLQSLQNLSLHENEIQEIENGSFIGLTKLTSLQLQLNNIERAALDKGAFNDLTNLITLELRNNHIQYDDSSALPHPPFSQLSRLETLAIPSQHRRGKSHLPCNFLQGLTNLSFFNARNIQLLSFPTDMFNYTPRLETLDMSSNDLVDLSPDLFTPIRSLKRIYISRTHLQSLDFLIDANLTELVFMQARWNGYSVISEDVMKSLPALIYVDFQGNSFTCDCNNIWFLQWAENNNQTQVFDAFNFECYNPPGLKGTKLLELNPESCTVNIDFICFVSTTCTILLFMVVSCTYHFLSFYLAYAYHFFLAVPFDAKHKNKQDPYEYDAFISYNTHDEPWVIRELLPKLEGEQGWRLCLHHRDFQPGKPIIDNITEAIYRSRKTICVISRRYLESEWCSREIQVASFRLFDEQKDVLIMVFLEDIPTYQLSPYYRMRKLLKRRTYLSWPQAKKHTELFWEKLRQALKAREDLGEDRLLLIVADSP
ncbi:toll-like receptor 13 isoform X1 [Chaetodon trifascialis]|uniref:toll-like receptor 13 isoform X1 n=1 Tax=Chaetodon trifascialis TaxID=109706 RepID=UPI0039958766